MIIIILWISLAYFLGKHAENSGNSFWGWFVLGVAIDPILAWLFYYLVTKDRYE